MITHFVYSNFYLKSAFIRNILQSSSNWEIIFLQFSTQKSALIRIITNVPFTAFTTNCCIYTNNDFIHSIYTFCVEGK